MRATHGKTRARTARLATAALVVVFLTMGSATLSSAKVSHQDLVDAQNHLAQLNDHLSLLIEQYDAANLQLQQVQARLADERSAATHAQASYDQARAYLSARAAQAYEGAGSQIDLLLGATTLADFTDRLEFLDSVANQDVEAATQAEAARELARRTAEELAATVRAQQALLKTLDGQKADIEGGIAEQKTLIGSIQKELSAQAAAAAIKKSEPPPAPSPPGGGTPSPSPTPPPPPPPPSGGAGAAVAAAFSAIGVPYVWGGDNPQDGFDCSGLTMWSWAQGGVSLPHSSAAQYDAVPHVSQDDLQPGDLLFFYSPIHHVAIYVGGGMVIEALHPGTTVLEDVPDWANYVGAGRP